MVIREAIKVNMERKCGKTHNLDYLNAINNEPTVVVIPLNNGVRIFLDIDPTLNKRLKIEYPEMSLEPDVSPNKNGVFKRISFSILNDKEPIIPESMKQYICETSERDALYYVKNAKERVVNEFISSNGGIDLVRF